MDLYTSERILLDRHRQRVADAERLSYLLAGTQRRHPWRVWTAGRLRAMAERLDRQAPHERRSVTLFRME
ncbi:MAG TPA: hypothetical protein VHO95_01570 [Candidatus Dormibacteraeota bacterium]|nr:hypothetical protein [Candidatus Dormibacteraeota bacterium]HEX2682178.1 hypothetical protein [Candidatus Dormibacteraeota bacterium]